MSAGRPSDYSPGLADKICEQLASGDSMRTVCAADEMPCMTTVFKWLREKPEFAQQYAKAKEEAATAMFEEIMDIADDGSNDWMEYHYGEDGKETGWKINGEALQRSRLRVDTRKWALSKLIPKKYGDRTIVDATVNDYTNMSSEDRRRRLMELQQELQNAERG